MLLAPDVRAHKSALGCVLIDCIEGGASVSLWRASQRIRPTSSFEDVANSIEKNERFLIAAFLDGALIGTVQVITAMPANQPHRAEVSKLLVARYARGGGVGSALMREAERLSQAAGKTLLVLDTATGSDAERLYERLEWRKAGVIPKYSLLPHGELCGTTIFWKELA